MVHKSFQERIGDLTSHAKLLQSACDRFIAKYDFDEIKNIGVRLRIIVGSGKGSGLLFELANESNDRFKVMTLNQYGSLKVTKIDKESGAVLQEKEKRVLFTQVSGCLPIIFPTVGDGHLYKTTDLQDWVEEGFLLDWDVPKKDGDSDIVRFTPRHLINRYAGQEAAHADRTYGSFGGPIEDIVMNYTLEDKNIVVPIVYEYLYHIGRTVSEVTLKYIEQHNANIT